MPFLVIMDSSAVVALAPGTRRYRIAGTVKDLANQPLTRKVMVITKSEPFARFAVVDSDTNGAFSLQVSGGPGQRFIVIVEGVLALGEPSRILDHITAHLTF